MLFNGQASNEVWAFEPTGLGPQLTETRHDEAYLSAVEPGAQAPPRVSLAHGHESWPQDLERTPRTRSGEAKRIGFTL